MGYGFYYIRKILIEVKIKKFGIKTLKFKKHMGTSIRNLRVSVTSYDDIVSKASGPEKS